MGVFTDLLANALTFSAGSKVAFAITKLKEERGDPPIPANYGTRYAAAALRVLNIIADNSPPDAVNPEGVTVGANRTSIPPWLVQELAQEAAAEANNEDVYGAIMGPLHGRDTAPLVTSTSFFPIMNVPEDDNVVGQIVMFGGTSIPSGWLECNGFFATGCEFPCTRREC